MRTGTAGLRLHGGGGVLGELRFYKVLDGRISNGLMNTAYVVNDVSPGDGGFCRTRGRHKVHFLSPASVSERESGAEHVRQISAHAGSAALFSKALINGTPPWRGTARHGRRTSFVRYSPGVLSFRYQPLPEDCESYPIAQPLDEEQADSAVPVVADN